MLFVGMAQALSAADLQRMHGAMLELPPFCDAACPYQLRRMLLQRTLPIHCTESAIRVWWAKYKVRAGIPAITNVLALEDGYGDSIRGHLKQHRSAYQLCNALRARDPPVNVSQDVVEKWMKKYGDITKEYAEKRVAKKRPVAPQTSRHWYRDLSEDESEEEFLKYMRYHRGSDVDDRDPVWQRLADMGELPRRLQSRIRRSRKVCCAGIDPAATTSSASASSV